MTQPREIPLSSRLNLFIALWENFLMKIRKSRNQPASARARKYEGRNNTKRVVK